MQLRIPAWVNHDGGAIYSIDCHPTNDKFATCGQGDTGGAGVVIVWNLAAVLSNDPGNLPKSLCTIRHNSGVNCVRWSPDGKRLACASDDNNVVVYEYAGRVQSVGSITSAGGSNSERYKECAILRGHTMEVLCVEWSLDRKYLASSSIDSRIFIWNASKLHEKVTVLQQEGAVKGISWDPIGKYLASISSDKSLRLWKTDNWFCDTTIRKPFEESSQTTMFSRMDWSADGQYLFAPTATNNEGPTAQIFDRQTWEYSRDFVGHRKATTCVRVLPRLLSYTNVKGKMKTVTCLAIGSRDKSVSVWLIPGIIRPVLVFHRLFKHSVMDMSWKGLNLGVCSQDGSVVFMSFSEKNLGAVLSNAAMAETCEKLYRTRPLQYRDEAEEDGNGEDSLHDRSFNSSFVETPQDLVSSKKNLAASKSAATAVKTINPAVKAIEKKLMDERKQQVEQVKDGKRRIQPVFLGTTRGDVDEAAPSAPANTETAPPKVVKTAITVPTVPKRVPLEKAEGTTAKRKKVESEDSTEESSESSDSDDSEATTATRNAPSTSAPQIITSTMFKKPQMRPVETTRVQVIEGATVLDPPEQKTSFVEPLPHDKLSRLIDVNNKWRCAGVEATRVSLKRAQSDESAEDTVEWAVVVASPVLIVAANKLWCVLGCGDRCLRIFCTQTSSSRCCLQLDSLPVRIGLNEHCVFVLTQMGKLSTWNLQEMCAVVTKQAIFECVTSGSVDANVNSLAISERGIPLISFSSGSTYTFSTKLQCWQLVECRSQLSRLHEADAESQLGDGQMSRVLKRMPKPTILANVPPTISKVINETRLEQLLQSAEAFQSSKDFKSTLLVYVEQLLTNGGAAKLQYILNWLEGPANICGLKRGALRADVVSLIESRRPDILPNSLETGAKRSLI
ncbi:unnamed protein product [Caenorhabditis auriculariae]|uniref:Protein HIRA n=1 Tax=Caenorhabditis auriculariae TaxID=2777116 RepID=A0A8S1GYS8_9PELO|nr:unnamed protein product [Caenorhabditis auriculariae]